MTMNYATDLHPQQHMRVSVKFEDGDWYDGELAQCIRNGNNKGWKLLIQYDDGDEEHAKYPDDDIMLCPSDSETSNDSKSSQKRQAVTVKSDKSSRKGAQNLPPQDSVSSKKSKNSKLSSGAQNGANLGETKGNN